MRSRSERQAAISRLVGMHVINAQEELLTLLHKEGFELTQATLSRDMKDMGVVKMPDSKGVYRYVMPAQLGQARIPEPPRRGSGAYGIIGVEISGQICVVHTLPGYASFAASLIDDGRITEVMGTIAGDDAVLIALRVGYNMTELVDRLDEALPGAKDKMMIF